MLGVVHILLNAIFSLFAIATIVCCLFLSMAFVYIAFCPRKGKEPELDARASCDHRFQSTGELFYTANSEGYRIVHEPMTCVRCGTYYEHCTKKVKP